MFTTLHKYYTLDEWRHFAENNPSLLPHVAVSSGTSLADYERMCSILNALPDVKYICIDVANGYSQHFVEYVRKVRVEYPHHTIIVSSHLFSNFLC